MALDMATLGSTLSFWEIAGYVATGAVIAGVAGESVVEFTNWIADKDWKATLGKASALTLIAGLALEIAAQVQVNTTSGQMIAFLNDEAGDAYRQAGKLGLSIGGLQKFVTSEQGNLDALKTRDDGILAATKAQNALFAQQLGTATGAAKEAKKNLDEMLAQLGGIQKVEQQVSADHSIKARIRGLLESIDRRIPGVIDSGQTQFVVRMEPNDITTLHALIAEPGGKDLISIIGYGGRMIDSLIDNGTLGPNGAVHEQIQVMLRVGPGLKGS